MVRRLVGVPSGSGPSPIRAFGVLVRLPTRLSAFGVALALLVGCGTTVSPSAAATVNGIDISRDLLETVVTDSLDALFATAEESGTEITDEERAQASEEQERQLLTLLIQDTVITSVAADAGAEVDDADRAAVRADIVEVVEGEDRLEELLRQDGLSLSLFEEVLVPQQARVIALREQLAEGETLETRTVRHILVETEEEADEVVAELEAGADFGELAQERSTDIGSGERGGELGLAPRGAYVPPFEEAAWEAELDQVVGPVESQFGFHVLEVIAEESTPGDELPAEQLEQLVNQELDQLISTAYDEADIQVDPAFGTWDEERRAVVPTENVGEPGTPEPDLGELGELEELEELDDLESEPVEP
jgi:peptidyl-prolyl cis-trans isomerase C